MSCLGDLVPKPRVSSAVGVWSGGLGAGATGEGRLQACRPKLGRWSPLQVLAGAGVKPLTIQRGDIPDRKGPEKEREWARCSRFYANGGALRVCFRACQYLV